MFLFFVITIFYKVLFQEKDNVLQTILIWDKTNFFVNLEKKSSFLRYFYGNFFASQTVDLKDSLVIFISRNTRPFWKNAQNRGRTLGWIASTFYDQFFRWYSFNKKLQSQTVIRKKPDNALLFKKGSSKMLMKLTPWVDFINILRKHFFVRKCFAQLFSVTFWLHFFLANKNIGNKGPS